MTLGGGRLALPIDYQCLTKLISGGRALPVSSLLLHTQSKEWDLSSCLELRREANSNKKKSLHISLSVQQDKHSSLRSHSTTFPWTCLKNVIKIQRNELWLMTPKAPLTAKCESSATTLQQTQKQEWDVTCTFKQAAHLSRWQLDREPKIQEVQCQDRTQIVMSGVTSHKKSFYGFNLSQDSTVLKFRHCISTIS